MPVHFISTIRAFFEGDRLGNVFLRSIKTENVVDPVNVLMSLDFKDKGKLEALVKRDGSDLEDVLKSLKEKIG